jgi:hypothetical protein
MFRNDESQQSPGRSPQISANDEAGRISVGARVIARATNLPPRA